MQGLLRSVEPYASRLIAFKARQLSRCPGFSLGDRKDIEQELWLALLIRLPQYDARRASESTFVARVIEHAVVTLLRHRRAEKRSPAREECSLDDPVLDADGRVVPRHETTPEAASEPGRLRDLERDVAQVVAGLSDDLRAAALALAFGTQNSVGPELGISRRDGERRR